MEYLKAALKYINLKALFKEYIMAELVRPAVRELVQKSENTLDDMLAELILVEVEKYGERKIDELSAPDPEPAA